MQLAYEAEWIEEILVDEAGDFLDANYNNKRFSGKNEAAQYAEKMAAQCGEAPYWYRVHALEFNEKYQDWDDIGTFCENGEFVAC